MTELELFMKMVNACEGLDVSFKIGKESELVIKGDFMKMLSAFGTMMQAKSDSNNASKKIQELNKNIIK